MSQDMTTIPRATRMLLISRYLERVADHAVNIAELVIFLVEGKIVRHQTPRGKTNSPPSEIS
jgi:phosphate transport system protein